MKASELVEYAQSHGMNVGRIKSGVYYWGVVIGGEYRQYTFEGGWAAFCKYIRTMAGEGAKTR